MQQGDLAAEKSHMIHRTENFDKHPFILGNPLETSSQSFLKMMSYSQTGLAKHP